MDELPLPPKQRRSGWRPWAVRALKLAVVLAVAWGVRGTVTAALDELSRQPRAWRPAWFVVSGVVYLVGLMPAAWFYDRVLRSGGQSPPGWSAWRAFYISELGKYVPGKAMVVVIRTTLAQGPTVDPTVAALGVFLETFSVMAVGCVLGAVSASIWLRDQPWVVAGAWGLALVAWVPLTPPVFRLAVRSAQRLSRDPPALAAWHVPASVLLPGWAAMAMVWVLWGVSLAAVLIGLGSSPQAAWSAVPRATAAATLGTCVGFFSLVPGGAVVRESVIMELLRPQVGDATALVAPIALRLVWLMSELVISVILYPWYRNRPE